MLVGLQGSGKTTSAAKLALYLKKKGKKVLLVPADIYRPAAIDQLKVLAASIEVDCYNSSPKTPVQEIVKAAQAQAKKEKYGVMIVDTAGRLQVDEKLMQELEEIKKTAHFQNTLLVVDAMTGQEALNIARAFNEKLELNGFLLSKMDGDARGGAAVSIRAITEKPIMYVGSGEKVEDLEDFHPDRVASKVLGMGDVLTLVEKASKQFEGQDLKSLEQRIKKNQFTLLDFQKQLEQLQKMGSLKSLLGMMPGLKIPDKAQGTTAVLHLYVQAYVDKTFERAIASGCEISMKTMNAFWGEKLRPSFGSFWLYLESRKQNQELNSRRNRRR